LADDLVAVLEIEVDRAGRVPNGVGELTKADTFLRPNLFMQGLLAFRETIIGQGKFFAAVGDARVSVIDVRDIAADAAAALTEEGHEGKTYDLTGPQALSHGEMAEKLSEALRRVIEFVDVPPEAMQASGPDCRSGRPTV
jgi:uncharacterized protein YbjT (DUF2867 family)